MKIRTKLLFPSILLLLFPAFAYHWQTDLNQTLRANKLANMATMATLIQGPIAKGLDRDLIHIKKVRKNKDLFASPLVADMKLDGKLSDWQSTTPYQYSKSDLIELSYPYDDKSLNYELRLSADNESLFVHLKIIDDTVVYRQVNNLSIHRNDHVKIAFFDKNNVYQRYTFASYQPAKVNAHLVTKNGRALRPIKKIKGFWLATENGYNLEFSMPLNLIGSHFSINVADVDDLETRTVKYRMGSGNTDAPDALSELGTLQLPSELLMKQLRQYPFSTFVVKDKFGRTIASHQQNTLSNDLLSYTKKLMFTDNNNKQHDLGTMSITENTDMIQSFQDSNTQKLLLQSIIIVLLGLLFWLAMSLHIATRIKILASNLGNAVDHKGRVVEPLRTLDGHDEISELSRNFKDTVDRLQQHNAYLEAMASRLAHELRTPVSVVQSSLESITTDMNNEDISIYVTRAKNGVRRLSTILNKMSEASRLEQSLDEEDIVTFDLSKVVRGCVEGYAQMDKRKISLSIEKEPLMLTGLPDLIAQCLDKLISNAKEFTPDNGLIKFRLNQEQDFAVLRIMNDGPPLPASMQGKLFDSMVSVRQGYDGNQSHLGLGLYIAKIITQFHSGTITIADREDASGVIVTIKIPIMRLSSKLSTSVS